MRYRVKHLILLFAILTAQAALAGTLLDQVSSDNLVKETIAALAERRGIECEQNPQLVSQGTSANDVTFEAKYSCSYGNTISVAGYVEDSQVQINSFIFNK